MTTLSFIYFYTLWGLLGLAIGSFLNVVIYRLPKMLQEDWAHNCGSSSPTLSLLFPRSFCPRCKTAIKASQNIPLLSYFLLQKRCYGCHQPISGRYPLVELITGLFTLFTIAFFGFSIHTLFTLLFIWCAIALLFIDLETQLLPDSLTLGLLWLGLLANTDSASAFTALPNAVFGAAGGYLSLWLFTQLFYLLRGKIGMGQGDFKLFAALGAWFGWQTLPFILFTASLTGAITGMLYLKWQKKDKDTPIAFGPFLVISGIYCLFFPNPAILPLIF
ncbi:MAG: prepilin peptidase [Legionella sp.]|nr:prepilin peptidase [Legionella sp.]